MRAVKAVRSRRDESLPPDVSDTPECVVCGETFSPERASLGYKTCLEHGEDRKEYTVGIPYNKGAYQLVSKDDVKDMV